MLKIANFKTKIVSYSFFYLIFLPFLGKDNAMEAEVKAARERQMVPLEQRMVQFQELLTEKKISAFSTWEKELHKIVFDSRYLLLTSKERKQVFEKYVRERADEVIILILRLRKLLRVSYTVVEKICPT